MAMMRRRQPAARQPSQPAYNSQLAQYASAEGFGAGAFNQARAAGFTDAQIKTEVESLRGQGMKIGDRVNIALNPATYGNEMAVRGATEGGFQDMGSESRYGMRAVMLPEGVTAGGGKGVVWAAGPMTDQQVINQLSGKPRESYVLPAGVNAPGEAYRGPAGTSYIDPSASAADQARMAAGTYGSTAPTSAAPSAPGGSTATTTPGRKLPSKIRDASFLGQAIRVAGESGGTIDRKEMKTIARTQGVSMKDVKERLAAVNEKRAGRDKAAYTVETRARDFAKGKAKEEAAKAPGQASSGTAAAVVASSGRTVDEKKNDVLKAARQKMGISEEKRADFAQRSAESKKAKAAAVAKETPARQAPARAAAPARQQAPARQAAGRGRK